MTLRFQNVREVLGELEDDPEYRAQWTGSDSAYHAFRQEVELAGIRRLDLIDKPTVADLKDRVDRLSKMATGSLSRFAPFVERAKAVLHA